MQVTYRIPSRKVQYGYLEFTVDEDQALPDPVELAEQYAQYIKDYQAAEVQAFEGKVKPRVIASVAANQAAEQARQKVLDQQTEDINEVAANEIKSQLGATDVTSAPWANAPSESKDWEEPKDAAPAAPVNDSDWDF